MKIVIAPDSFKESLTALQASNAIEKGFKSVFPNATYIKIPMADGGEGTVQSLVDATNGKIIKKNVVGPLGNQVEAFFGLLGNGKTAVIEMAAASGLHLVPQAKRNPLITTTWGTGELILAALNYGVDHIIIGIGGSATNDGGAGMAQALGVQLLDVNGRQIGFGGENLRKLKTINISKLDARLKHTKIEVACDVNNPLTGVEGAAAIYGPQKGATPEMVRQLDQYLLHYADLIKNQLGIEVNHFPGSGAAGGLGAGLLAFLNAELRRGIEIVLEATELESYMKEAAFVITGEGRIDSQTIFGKTPIGVANIAKKHKVPVIAIAGSIANDADVVYKHGIDALFSMVPGVVSIEDAFERAEEYLELTAKNIAILLKMKIQTT